MDWLRSVLFSKIYSYIDDLYDAAQKCVERVNSAFKILKRQEDEIKRLNIEVLRLSEVFKK